MEIREAQLNDLDAITDIYNYEVLNGVNTFDITPKGLEDMLPWFEKHNTSHYPLIVMIDEDKVIGYASLSPYREKEAYKTTVELSVYVHPDHRKKGVATKLLEYLVEYAKKEPTIHTIVSVITSGNRVSVKLHKKFEFKYCGRVEEVGLKFNHFQSIDNFVLIVK